MKNVRFYLFVFFCLTLFSLGFFVLILFNINPFTADLFTLSIFYISLFIFLTGIFTLLLFYLRIKLSNNEIFFANFNPSLRQSILISLSIVIILILKTLNVLSWWDGLLFVFSILLIEMYFQNKQIIKN
jgi:hypothetical protein